MHAAMLQVEISRLWPNLQNILRQSYDFLTIGLMPMLRYYPNNKQPEPELGYDSLWGTKVRHSAGSLGWSLLMLKYRGGLNIFFKKCTEAIQTALGNCYGLKLPKWWLQFNKKILCHL